MYYVILTPALALQAMATIHWKHHSTCFQHHAVASVHEVIAIHNVSLAGLVEDIRHQGGLQTNEMRIVAAASPHVRAELGGIMRREYYT
jgi:hypothetical protein